jgi:adenosylmethionine-8-amino-7-oxononanoate aminotransferase
MTDWNTEELVATDKQFVWHPFTNMPEWCAPEHEPIVIVEGHGALLRDSRGPEYIDGNSARARLPWVNAKYTGNNRIAAAALHYRRTVGTRDFSINRCDGKD